MPTRNKQRLGERIRQLRESRDWSQGFLAKKIKVSRPTVSQWESGDTKNIKNDNLIALAEAFEMSMEELLTGKRQYEVREAAPGYNSISQDEQILLEKYRHMNDEERRRLHAIITALDAETG